MNEHARKQIAFRIAMDLAKGRADRRDSEQMLEYLKAALPLADGTQFDDLTSLIRHYEYLDWVDVDARILDIMEDTKDGLAELHALAKELAGILAECRNSDGSNEERLSLVDGGIAYDLLNKAHLLTGSQQPND